MINAIPNPKKKFQIEKSSQETREAIENIPLYTEKYKVFKSNPTLNLITFEASEFLSIGVYIDVNYFSISDSKTEVEIEIRRKIGTFNQSHEVSLANQHISNITDLLSKSLITDPTPYIADLNAKLEARRIQNEKSNEWVKNNPKLALFLNLVGILVLVGLLIFIISLF